MQLTDAQISALPTLLSEISAMQQVCTAIQDLVNDPTAFINGNVGVGTAASGNANLQLPPMTPQESTRFFTSALSVYQARLSALDAQLSAL